MNTIPFLQTPAWAEFQRNLGRNAMEFSAKSYYGVAVHHKLPLGKSYIYLPRGPVFKSGFSQEALSGFVSDIIKERKAGTIFLRVEPAIPDDEIGIRILETGGFRKTEAVQPEATRLLDLAKSEDTLLAEMEYEARYSIRLAKRRGVTVKSASAPDDKKHLWPQFWKLFKETNERHHLKAYPEDYYRRLLDLSGVSTRICVGYAENEPIAAAIFLSSGGITTYLYSASKKGVGKYNAPTLLLWEAVNESRKRGDRLFDLWGISDEREDWAGITAFKRSFGGYDENYVGTWDLVFDKKWYFFYKIALGLRAATYS